MFIGTQTAMMGGSSEYAAANGNVVIGSSRGLFNELTGKGNTIIGAGTDSITTTDNSGDYNIFIGCAVDSGVSMKHIDFLGVRYYVLLSGIIDDRNLAIGTGSGSFGSGEGVIFINNANTVPTTNPTGGGILCPIWTLKYRGSSGTVTIANA